MKMKSVEERIADFIVRMREYGVEITPKNPHWIAKNLKKEKQARQLLVRFFKKFGLYSEGCLMRKLCNSKHCMNPFHYGQVIDDRNISRENLIEIEELTEMIDLDDLQDMGFKRYLLYFNEDNPIPAKPNDFFIACNRRLRAAKLTQLPREILNE